MKDVAVDIRGQEKGSFEMEKYYELIRHGGGNALGCLLKSGNTGISQSGEAIPALRE